MNQFLQRIDEKKRQLDSYRPLPPELVKNLDDWFRVELTYTSNAIEGNTLSRQETALVVEKGLTVVGKTLREHLEAINHAQALDFIGSLVAKPRQELSENEILDIHNLRLSTGTHPQRRPSTLHQFAGTGATGRHPDRLLSSHW